MKTLHLVDENIAIILSSVSANQHLDEVYSLWELSCIIGILKHLEC